MQEQFSEIIIHIKGALKYKWIAIFLAWPICIAGWTIVTLLPNIYTSEATVHVDTKTMLQPLLEGMTVQSDTRALLQNMKKMMFTRPNMEKILQMSNVEFAAKDSFAKEEQYKDLKKDMDISGGGTSDLFKIKYVNKDPDIAKAMVDAVLNVFSDQTHQSTLSDVSSSQRFIEQQIREYEVRLRNAETARESFKRANFGLLPEAGAGQLAKLHRTKDELESAKLLLSEAISRKHVLAKQMQEVINSGDTWRQGRNILIELSPEEQKIKDLRLRKTELLLKYTQSHPEVKAIELTLKESIRLKELNKKKTKNTGLPNADVMANPYVQQLKSDMNRTEAEVASARARVNVLMQRTQKLNEELNSRLTVETEIKNLNRDYETIRDNYQQLVQRREKARISENIDTQNMTLELKIVDPSTRPLKPSSPKRIKLFAVVLILGLGAGFGLAYLLCLIKPTYISTKQLRELTGLPVLGSVSMIVEDETIGRKDTRRFVFVTACLVFVFVGVVGFEIMRLNQINPFTLMLGIK